MNTNGTYNGLQKQRRMGMIRIKEDALADLRCKAIFECCSSITGMSYWCVLVSHHVGKGDVLRPCKTLIDIGAPNVTSLRSSVFILHLSFFCIILVIAIVIIIINANLDIAAIHTSRICIIIIIIIIMSQLWRKCIMTNTIVIGKRHHFHCPDKFTQLMQSYKR